MDNSIYSLVESIHAPAAGLTQDGQERLNNLTKPKGLEPLKPLEQELDAALRGMLVHDVLDRFVKAYPDEMPDDAARQFVTIARKELDVLGLEDLIRIFWEPRLAKIAGWLVGTEQAWRQDMLPMSLEKRGAIVFDAPYAPFTLNARRPYRQLARWTRGRDHRLQIRR